MFNPASEIQFHMVSVSLFQIYFDPAVFVYFHHKLPSDLLSI